MVTHNLFIALRYILRFLEARDGWGSWFENLKYTCPQFFTGLMMTRTELQQRIIQKLETMESEKLAIVASFLDSLDVSSGAKNQQQGSSNILDEQRRELIRSLRGKYANSSVSSEEFSRRKQEDIDWENRNR